jgi:hypothetical protein
MCRLFAGRVELVAAEPGSADDPVAAWAYGDFEAALDHALRVDVLVRLLTGCACQGVRAVSLVHVRSGPHEPGDHDLAWAAAARVAAGISGVDVDRVVALSRWGWHDLGSGTQRTWVRLRRSAAC